jgi:hypothetical protein
MLQHMLYIVTTVFSGAKMLSNLYRQDNYLLTIHDGTLLPHLTQHPSIISSQLILSYDRSIASSKLDRRKFH